jgi:hypothetical protein
MDTSERFAVGASIRRTTRVAARPVAFILAVVVMASLAFLAGCSGQPGTDANTGNPSTENTGGEKTQAPSQQADPQEAARQPSVPEGADIVILLSDVTETARFYPTTAEGVDLEVLAIRAPDGTVRTAFNTCQVCFNSGRGYYVQEGDNLVCQNCGNQFAASRVEIESGGCNPVPIFEGDKVTDDTTVTIPADYLKEARDLFEGWKR